MAITIIILALIFLAFMLYGLATHSATASLKCSIELVPVQMHGFNVRSRLQPSQWQQVCKAVHAEANQGRSYYLCQQCGESGLLQGFSHPVECHEIWRFNRWTRTQKLAGLLSLCPMCHKVKHIGLARTQGFGDRAFEHMRKHNHWTDIQAEIYMDEALAECTRKRGSPWKLDLTYLNQAKFSCLNIRFTSDEANNCDQRKVF